MIALLLLVIYQDIIENILGENETFKHYSAYYKPLCQESLTLGVNDLRLTTVTAKKKFTLSQSEDRKGLIFEIFVKRRGENLEDKKPNQRLSS